jgi:dihydroorotate dehydrogenase
MSEKCPRWRDRQQHYDSQASEPVRWRVVSFFSTFLPDVSDVDHPANKAESGGLSGAPLKQYSLATLRTLRRLLPESIPLIGCGGISTGADALEYAKAGASFVQVYTGFGYDGVGFCRRIKDELVQELDKEGTTWRDVVHKAVKELSLRVEPAPAKKESSSKSYIGLLIKEAEDLKKLLDQLGERIEKDGFDESVVAAPPLAL